MCVIMKSMKVMYTRTVEDHIWLVMEKFKNFLDDRGNVSRMSKARRQKMKVC